MAERSSDEQKNLLRRVVVDWTEDIERKTILEHRKLVTKLATKQYQLSETLQHIRNGTCPTSIKATAQLPVPVFLESEVADVLQEVIRNYELQVLDILRQIREQEIVRLKKSLEDLLPRHISEVQRQRAELANDSIIPANTPYDDVTFRTRLAEDAQVSKFLVHKARQAKQVKRDKLAEKKTDENTDQS